MEAGALFNPFPGLRPFEPEEDHLFFGREGQVDELLRKLRSSRFLCVLGTSGSGKSSLVRCGLIPALHGGFMVQAGSSWRISVLRPGENPVKNLAAALTERGVLGIDGELASTNQVMMEATLLRSSLGLVDAFRRAQVPAHENLLIVVDQFEELFRFRTTCQNDDFRDGAVAFIKLLLEATQQQDFPIYVVLTVRSDFIGDCMEYPGLPEAVNAGMFLVPRMTRDELRAAITGPVAVGGGQIAPRLVLRLLNDVGDDQDQLPVLQHALMRTWDHWHLSGRVTAPIDVADYEAIGTLQHALSLHAEEAYLETGSPERLRLTERMFKALTDTFSDPRGVRRPTTVRELAAISNSSELEVIKIVEIFRQRGRCFLMPPAHLSLDSRSVVDISHESLMRCWARLITWAEEERRSADFYVRLSKAAGWFEEKTAGLWRDPELEFGLRWWVENEPTQAWAERYNGTLLSVVEFLGQSKQERERAATAQEAEQRKRLRQAQWAAGILGAVLLIVGYLSYLARTENTRAESNLNEARTAVDDALSSVGRQQARVDADTPEMEAFREQLLKKAQTFYLDFARQEHGNEGVRAGMAAAHSRLGDIDRLLGSKTRGDALEEYSEAILEFEALAKQYPRKPEYQESLGYGYNFLGVTLGKDAASDAEKAYENALKAQQNLTRQYPQNWMYQQELARTYYNRGILRHDTQRPQDSESDFRKAIQLLQTLGEEGSDPPPAQELARVYNNLGNLLREKNRGPEATQAFERAITIDEGLEKKAPTDGDYKLELAKFYNNFALLLLDEKHIEMAEQRNREALDLLDEVAAPAPSLSIEIANVHNAFARALGAQEPKEALKICQQSMDILEKLKSSAVPPQGLQEAFRDLAYSYVLLASRSLQSGSVGDARMALDSLMRLLPDVPAQNQPDLNKYYNQLLGKIDKPN